MSDIRRRGLWSILAGLSILAPAFGYLWFVDYRGAYLPSWATGVIVAFCTPAVGLIFTGLVAVLTGKLLRPLKLSLERRPGDLPRKT